jgi:hypothetical protein
MKELLLSCSANKLPKKSLVKAKTKYCFQPIHKINEIDGRGNKYCESVQKANDETIQNYELLSNMVKCFFYCIENSG